MSFLVAALALLIALLAHIALTGCASVPRDQAQRDVSPFYAW
jgi:hypothetical protein